MEETKIKIAVMQAYVDGKEIEYLCPLSKKWDATLDVPQWHWYSYDYRVKEDNTWKCAMCKEEQTSETACVPKYKSVSCCSSKCANAMDAKVLAEFIDACEND